MKCLSFLFFFVINILNVYGQFLLSSSEKLWEIELSENGIIQNMRMNFGDGLITIPWHNKIEYVGPSFSERKSFSDFIRIGDYLYKREDSELAYFISYSEDKSSLLIKVSIENKTNSVIMVNDNESSLCLGIDHEMDDPRHYFSKFFPSMLRCEKTHFWGYFQSPEGNIIVIASPDPVASWHLDYIGKGHRIATTKLDLLHSLPLPSRHPQNLFQLNPGEKKTWNFYLFPLSKNTLFFKSISERINVPILELDRTTISYGEIADIKVYTSLGTKPKVTIISPLGESFILQSTSNDSISYSYEFCVPPVDGTYRIVVTSNNFISEGSLYARKPWSWYLKQAGREALRMEQKPSKHRESWMGFFSAYLANIYFPNTNVLDEIESKFHKFWNEMIDPQTGFYYTTKPTWASRPQNTSWMLALLITRYAATRKIEDLELAAKWGDYFIKEFQLPDGAYKGYTALTLGAKMLLDLMWFEKPLIGKSRVWKDYYERHLDSVRKASKNILQVKDLGDTEGESTYEDTQSGSAWSLLAMHALLASTKDEAEKFLLASEEVHNRHKCLTQSIIPDSRMRGGTFRWWESQYDVLIHKNMMNSPHAWTMRSQFGALYLYLLTGKESYLNIAFNAMASCVQSIDHNTGILRWAFVPDPFIKTKRFVPNYRSFGEGKYVDDILGEQWLPMISDWWRTSNNEVVEPYEKGWSCDNDVHEHFRHLSEQFISNSFIIERPDGTIRSWNCRIKNVDNKIIIFPSDDLVSRIHVNLQKSHEVIVRFRNKGYIYKLNKGMKWVGPGLNDYRVPSVYLWREMIK